MSVQINIGIVRAIVLLVVVILVSAGTSFAVVKFLATNQAILDPANYEIRWNHAEKSDRLLYDYLEAALAFYPKGEHMTFLTVDPSDGQMKIFTIRHRGKNQPFVKLAEYTFAESPREVAVRLKQSEKMP